MSTIYTNKQFNLPKDMPGLSDLSIESHIGLYEGYVANFNAMTELISELQSGGANQHSISELIRRQSFEFDGMRLHEYYFNQFEDAPTEINMESILAQKLMQQFGSIDIAISMIKSAGMMRGPGWAILYYDKDQDVFHIGFSGEQHQGHFVTLPIIIALDVWEHAYLNDYGTTGKGGYIDAFFANLNWEVIESRMDK